MMSLLVIKERIIYIYQKISMFATPVFKFLLSFIVFWCISDNMGYDTRFTGGGVLFLLSLLGAFIPSSVLVFLAGVLSVVHIYYISKILSIIVVVMFLVLYLLFARFTPKYGYVLLAVPVLYLFKMPYLMPLFLGMTATPLAILPMLCGTVIYYLFVVVKDAAQLSVNNSVEDILALYKYVVDALLGNKLMLLSMAVFSIVLICVYVIRRTSINYSFYIAIGAGALINIIGFLLGGLKFDFTGMASEIILGTLFSVVITLIVQFFRLTLDYTAVERTQFEDDDYYYYVKAVPKMKVTAPEKNIKMINVQNPGLNTADLGQTLRDLNLPPSMQDKELREREYGDD